MTTADIARMERDAEAKGYAVKVAVDGDGFWRVVLVGSNPDTDGRSFTGVAHEEKGIAQAYGRALSAATSRLTAYDRRLA